MSPEIVMGEAFDLPTDVYSLGILFIEILTRIVVGAKVYSRQAPIFTPDPDEVRRRATPGCPADLIDLALQCCSFAPEDRPTLPEILLRLRGIEMMLPDEGGSEMLRASHPLRREGKRAIPLFDVSNESELGVAEVEDQLTLDDESEEKRFYQALVEADILIDGNGANLGLVSSSHNTLAEDQSDDLFYNTASEIMRKCEVVC